MLRWLARDSSSLAGLIRALRAQMTTEKMALPAEKGAVELTKSNFDELVLNSGKIALVVFTEFWVGDWKWKLKPAIERLGEELKHAASSSVLIGVVDCDPGHHKDLCDEHGVRGFPTVKYYSADTGTDGKNYDGGLKYDDLKKWVSPNVVW